MLNLDTAKLLSITAMSLSLAYMAVAVLILGRFTVCQVVVKRQELAEALTYFVFIITTLFLVEIHEPIHWKDGSLPTKWLCV